MENKIKKRFLAFLVSTPIVFTLLFFGYLNPRFDVVFYTDNIKGEGTCSAYLGSSSQTFSYLYKADAYFGSELKTLHMKDLRYDTNRVTLYLYGVEEADILAYDIGVFGFAVLHHNSEGNYAVLRRITTEAIESNEKSIVHIINENPENSFSIDFEESIGIPAWVWTIYFAVLLLLIILLAEGLIILFIHMPSLRLLLLEVSAILAAMIMGCFICGSLPYVNYTYFLLNWLLLYAASLLLNSVTLPWLGTLVVSGLTLFWYIANYFVIKFRSKPIMPADLKAAGTAKEVVGGYDLTPNWQIILGVAVFALYAVVIVVLWTRTKADRKKTMKQELVSRGCTILVALAMVYLGFNNPAFSRLNEFQWDAKVLEGFHREGIVLTYIKSAMSAHVARPEGYSREAIRTYLEEYQNKSEQSKGIQPTRIIMVMNEAFSDMRVDGVDERINVMPFIDSLDENTVKGSLFVSVLGGGTCNTEFEALTGNSLAFLGSGAYPYTENVLKPLFSLASYFENKGYFTEAFHANQPQNWNRDKVYPNLGFNEFYSIDRYPEITSEKTLHLYVSDQTDYEQIKAEDEKHKEDSRFLFGVTIQNHADYDHFYDVQEDETVKQYGSEYSQSARVYLSLIKASDEAIQKLVEQYQNSEEPTMIIFFGDHQPYLGGDSQDQIYSGISNILDYFRTIFFVWTNYETVKAHNLGISANYLPWLILEQGNFPLPPYVQMLKELYEAYPMLTSQGVVSTDGELYDSVAEVMDDPLIRKYQYIQYATLFDEIDPAWFEVP